MAVAGAHHDAMLAEGDGGRVAIFGLVVNSKQRHRQSIIVIWQGIIYSDVAQFPDHPAATIGNEIWIPALRLKHPYS
jgi:hypothetical protein